MCVSKMSCNIHYSSVILLILSSLVDANYICIKSEPSDKKLSVEERLNNDAKIVAHTKQMKEFPDSIRIVNKTITQDVYLDLVLKQIVEIDTVTTIYKFKDWYVPRFRHNYDILLLDFHIPRDTRELIFIFFAHESKVNEVGGECKPKGVELVLKPQAFPISNISLPERFMTTNEYRVHRVFKSDSVSQTIRIDYPPEDNWFVRVYQSWTNPNDDSIEQKGMAAKCETYISGQVSVEPQIMISVINCHEPVEINLEITETILTDHYKCLINTESTEHVLHLSVNVNEEVDFIVLAIEGKKIASLKPKFQCALEGVKNRNQNVTLKFNPHVNKWHYLAVTYGKNISKPSSLNNIQICDTIDIVSPYKVTVNNLIRLPMDGLFSFEYKTIENFVSIMPGELQALKFDVFPINDVGGVLSIETNFHDKNDSSVDLIYCFGLDEIVSPNGNRKCQSNFKITEPDLILNNDKWRNDKSNFIHIPYPKSGVWYITIGAFQREKDDLQFKNYDEQQFGDYLMGEESGGIDVNVKITSSACFRSRCGKYGTCQIVAAGSLMISACKCYSGFTGWLCSDDIHVPSQSEFLLSILFLTLSNLFFIPAIVLAIRRYYFIEALVYTFTMFFSTFYHACDDNNIYYGYCITKFGVLQYADFFCGILSFWVTLVAMASLNTKIVSFLHVFATVLIAFGTKLDRFSLNLFLTPIVSGIIIIAASWIIHWKLSGTLFPGKKYLMFFLPAGVGLAFIGLMCFAFLQTYANYHIVHSIWHIVVAVSILLLLPIRNYFFTDDYPASDTDIPRSISRILKKAVV